MDPKRNKLPNDRARRSVPAAIIAVLLLALAMRGIILFTGQRFLRSDEAVVGLMAKHIVTRGEMPLFLYGQEYGGGHAIVAYIAAPLFAIFGRSAILLTAVSMTISMLNIWLLWIILRRYFPEGKIAVAGTALYALSPPVLYGAFLINGGTESFCLALLGLIFFLKAYLDNEHPSRNALLAGIFSGLAYYAMDYTLVYPMVFGLVWLATGRTNKWRCLGLLVLGFIAGCMPLIIYNFTHDFGHVRHMFSGGTSAPLLTRVLGALRHTVTQGLPAFFGGDIDDYRPGQSAGVGAWIHACAAMIAVIVLMVKHRGDLSNALKRFSLDGRKSVQLPPALIPVVFMLLYMFIYCVAKFSQLPYRTPRYFLPLCPFVSIAIATAVLRVKSRQLRMAGYVLIAFLLLHGAFASLKFGLRPWHEEHRIKTSGGEIARLADWLEQKKISTAIAPYEIQWRLLFASDERILVSCNDISPLPRYDFYSNEVSKRIQDGQPFALIVRRDFGFMKLSMRMRGSPALRRVALEDIIHAWLKNAGFSDQAIGPDSPARHGGQEFILFYPLTSKLLSTPVEIRDE